MEFLTTPAARFEHLKDYPFAPHFVPVDDDGLLMHYVDEGPAAGPVVLLLHGNPTWSYLYRSMIPLCVHAGLRAVAPDLIGFGKSSKPVHWQDHRYQAHCDWLRQLIERLDLRDITLFCQDWGSLIALRLATQAERRFARIVVTNGALPDSPVHGLRAAALRLVQHAMRVTPWLPIERALQFGTIRALDEAELRAYRAPFPDIGYMSGIRGLPQQLPLFAGGREIAANRTAWGVLERWEKPLLTLFSDGEWITRAFARPLQTRVPGGRGMPHRTVPGRHFVQEDSGRELAAALIEFVRAYP